MNVRCLIILLLAVLVASCRPNEPEAAQLEVESWDMPVGLSSATSVVWNDTLYVLFGRERTGSYASQSPHPKGYAVSLADPTVQREFALPVKPRVKAAGVLVGDDYYFGLGFNGKVYSDTANLTDWWRWNFKDRTLHRLADMMTKDTDAAIVWAVGRKIYMSLGFSTIFSGRSYCYDIETDKWEVISDNTIDKVRAGAVGQCVAGRSFAGGGCDTHMFDDWNEFDYSTSRWVARKRMPTKGRIFAASAADNSRIYVLGGRYFGGTETDGHFYKSVICYDVAADSWRVLGNMPEAAEHQIAFFYNNHLYFGMGQDAQAATIPRLYRVAIK